MDYFRRLQELMNKEKAADRAAYEELTSTLSIYERRENGMSWYPVAIRDTELGRGDYLTVEVERTSNTEILHNLRFGMTAALFSNHDPKEDRVEGTITHVSGNRLKLSLRTDELPDWTRRGKLGIDSVFDENSYSEMQSALKAAAALSEKKEEGRLVRILTGAETPAFEKIAAGKKNKELNASQESAINKILEARDLAIVHGPPGTGKTTTLVEAICRLLYAGSKKILVCAPSNAAVDLLSEKLAAEGLNVVRIGNPARVGEGQLALTLDSRIAAHPQSKEIKRLKKQAAEYRDLAHKYKRSFGPAEREQRKALFNEARQISREVENTEQYIAADLLDRAQVITATLVGANHYSIRNRQFDIAIIDEAAQVLEAACWIPILKTKKLVMAGDPFQLPPTVKDNALNKELGRTLMEKNIGLHPEAVVMLNEQYRMHQKIGGFSSKEFYRDELKPHSSVAGHLVFNDDRPMLFVDTAGCGFEEKLEGRGLSNPEEATFLVRLLQAYLVEASPASPTVALIAPYRHQVELLRSIATETLDENQQALVTVNTVDSFQGAERDAVFISLTRSNADQSIGFLSEVRRMNVAMTRARKKLVLVGDGGTLGNLKFYEDLLQYTQLNEAYVSAWEFSDLF